MATSINRIDENWYIATVNGTKSIAVKLTVIPIPLNYCPLVLIKISQGGVALNPHKPAIGQSSAYP